MLPSLVAALLLLGVSIADEAILHDFSGYQAGLYGTAPSQTYHSSDIISPLFNYGTWRKDLLAGDESSHIILTLNYDGAGPYLFRNDDLSLVYADPSFGSAMNARIQTVDGTDYLTVWHGDKLGGHAKGHCVFYDDRYRLKYNVTLRNPLTVHADMHECEVTRDGTVLLTAYQHKPFDLSVLGFTGDDVLADSCFQEVDIKTNALVFSWCASDHFSPQLSFQNFTTSSVKRGDDYHREDNDHTVYSTPAEGLDLYHINSLQKTKAGNYLVSLRPLKLITLINGKTGEPIWNLGGYLNEFTDITPATTLKANKNSDGALSFGWQHDVKFRDEAETQITMFDNHNLSTTVGCNDETCGRGRHIQIDTTDPKHLTVQLVHDYFSPHGLKSHVMGSMQPISPASSSMATDLGNVLVGWGANAEFTEHTSNGQLVRDVEFSPLDPLNSFGGTVGASSYRTYKRSWRGYPPWEPKIAVDNHGSLWVNWNGATEVRQWSVYGGETENAFGMLGGWGYDTSYDNTTIAAMNPLVTAERAGFETAIVLGGLAPSFVKVAAVDRFGTIIGVTRTAKMDPPLYGCGAECLALESVLIP